MNRLIQIKKFSLPTRTFRLISSKATDYSESYSTEKEEESEKTIHSGGFKRDHDDSETRKSVLDCKNEQWYPTQLNSNEDYKNMKLGNEGDGSKLFPYRYGNSFWDPHNYN